MWIKTEQGWRPFACPSAVLSPATVEPTAWTALTANYQTNPVTGGPLLASTEQDKLDILAGRADFDAANLAVASAIQANAFAVRVATWNAGKGN